ncbi:MAG TPA: NAD(P)-dependent oxidoreductase [Chthoniobacterales bacterium]|nr:NAD(P)-dependent oxidoreductase [Chthoniobacterales bacterium]
MKVAFLGLGNMGAPMGRNLVKAGHQVTVWNRTRERAKEVSGAVAANTPAEAAKDAEVAITMLADDLAAETVVFGENGLLQGLPKGSIHVSSSTISVELSRRIWRAHEEQGQRYVGAPVFGRPEAAEAAKLFIVAAGAPDAVKKCEPLLSAIGQKTFVMGTEPPLANVVKVSGNFLIASIIESLGEAVALTRKYGLDPQTYVDFLTNSLFSAPVFKTYGGLIVSGKFEPAGFKLRLGLKDVRLALAAAHAADVPLPTASLLQDHALEGVANGMGDLDWSSLAKVAAMNAGLK